MITKIEKITRAQNGNYFVLFLDNGKKFKLSPGAIIELKIYRGKELTEKDLKTIEKYYRYEKIDDYVRRFLSFRPRSKKEVVDRLRLRGYSEDLIAKVIKKFEEKKILDDESFARSWVESRMILRPQGVRLLRLELKNKGVIEDIIEKVINSANISEFELALRSAQKKLRAFQKLPEAIVRQKLIGFLSRRGFNWGTIQKVLKEVLVF